MLKIISILKKKSVLDEDSAYKNNIFYLTSGVRSNSFIQTFIQLLTLENMYFLFYIPSPLLSSENAAVR